MQEQVNNYILKEPIVTDIAPSPVYANGYIFLTARDGVVNVIKAGREFQIVSTNSIGEAVAASPVIADGTLYLRSYDALYAIGKKE